MNFASARFLGFLAVLFVLYYLIPRRHQWKLLLAGSLFFYWFAGWYCLVYILVTAVTTYLTGRKLGNLIREQDQYLKEHKEDLDKEQRKAYKAAEKKRRFRWMMLCLLLNFGILAVVKYTNFIIGNINSVMTAVGSENLLSFRNLALPMGISFYTFQSMGYLLDVYRNKYPEEKNAGRFILFVTFFPQLIQGPISRYNQLAPTLYAEHPWNWDMISRGIQRVIWGYFKKLVIADRLLIPLRTMLDKPEEFQGVYVLAVMFLYAVQLYADFTGGIDITIGVAQMLGVEVTENFHRPFFSKNTEEYWRRWHITMGSWFRDYIFYPLSVSTPMRKLTQWSRGHLGEHVGKRFPVYVATILLWFVTGVWHGASWNFIVWGLLNGVVIIVSQEFEPLYEKFHARFPALKPTFGYRLFQVIRTFWLMSAIRVLDCYRDVPLTFRQVGTVFTRFNPGVLFDGSFLKMGIGTGDWIIAAVGALLMLACSLLGRKKSVRDRLHERSPHLAWCGCVVMILAILIFGVYGIGYDATQFIYNQF